MEMPGEVATVLVVDDEPSHLESLQRILTRDGYRAIGAKEGAEALDLLRRERVNVMVSDLMMPGTSGQDLLRAAKTVSPETEVILITAYGTVETAVGAMKEGAYDFITKPLKRHALLKSVRQALEKQSLVQENRALRARLAGLGGGGGIVGQSPIFRAAMDLARQAAPSSATVLLLGESGTGKELFARLIHDLSPRAQAAFVPINCAAIPESLLESELFGYEKGAFTGAAARREGRIERAHGGTLFLDEVAEMPLQIQVKLLRVLQDGEIERLGGRETLRVDARVVAATNKDLEERVREGQFREDLYYRLNVITVKLPPLRARREDIGLLAHHFMRQFAEVNKKAVEGYTPAALEALESYDWPGNIRELEKAVERAVVLSRGPLIDADGLPEKVRGGGAPGSTDRAVTIPLGTPMEEVERRMIHETLRQTRGDKPLAARLLGIALRTLYRKLQAEEKPE